jgi:hypothetical protein
MVVTFAVIKLVTIFAAMLSVRKQAMHSGCQDPPCFLPAALLSLQAETAISYPYIVIKYVVFLKALQPHMGVIFTPWFLV